MPGCDKPLSEGLSALHGPAGAIHAFWCAPCEVRIRVHRVRADLRVTACACSVAGMERTLVMTAAILGALGVAAGAFGAHGLREQLSPEQLRAWNTGADYHLLHAIALLGVAWARTRWPGAISAVAAAAMVLGIVVFSGSLYVLALSGMRWLGMITPIGGLAFIVGWLALALAAWRG